MPPDRRLRGCISIASASTETSDKEPTRWEEEECWQADIQNEPRHWHSGHGHGREPRSALVQHYAGKRLSRLSIETRRRGRFVSHQSPACLSDQLASASAGLRPVSTGSLPPFLSCTTYAAMAREIASSSAAKYQGALGM